MHARAGVLTVFALLTAAGGLPAAPAFAQSTAAERCRALPTETERFACMEQALAAAESALAATQEPETDDGFLGLGILGGGRSGDDLYDSDSAVAEGLGAEQVAAANNMLDERDETTQTPRVQATVVAFRERVPGQLVFELDNGQVWRQTDADTQNLRLSRNSNPAVEMWSTRLGGYRMRFVDMDRVVMVQRMQ